MRVSKLRLFAEYLCGVEPPLMSYDVERSCYVSTVAPLSATVDHDKLPYEAPELSDTEAQVSSTATYLVQSFYYFTSDSAVAIYCLEFADKTLIFAVI